jgi:hypothetical protein
VILSLNGVTIPSDGYVLASDIGTGDSGLHCNTDRSDCCRGVDGVAQGHWYLPDGSQVGSLTVEDAANTGQTRYFFYRDRNTGVVRLNRLGNPSERGRFRCEVANAAGVMVTMDVNVGEWFVDYLLNCVAVVSDTVSFCSSEHYTHRTSCDYHQ